MELDDLSPSERLIADRLGTLVAPPSAETRARLLAAMRATPATASAGPRLRRLGRFRLVLLSASAVAVLLGGGAGALGLSAHALPGSPAYSLRLTGEHLRLWVAGPADRERLRLEFARERLQEARDAAHSDRSVIATLLHDSEGYLADAGRDLQQSGIDEGTRNDVQREMGHLNDEQSQIGSQFGVQGPSGQPTPAGAPGSGGPSDSGQNGGANSGGAAGGGTGQRNRDPVQGASGAGAAPSVGAAQGGQENGDGSQQRGGISTQTTGSASSPPTS